MTQLVEPLEKADFTVIKATKGDQAITTLQREGKNIRALITDVNLGGGMSGWDVAQTARELNPDLPVIYTTSYGSDEWSAHGVPNSIHITKPFVPAQVITALSQLLNSSHQEPSNPDAT
ncbi:MAG: response regulator [Pseudolabrys sp.]|nr:response regulator [Pseudolabrys sp.]